MKRGRITTHPKSEEEDDESASLQVGTILQLTESPPEEVKPRRKKGEPKEEKLPRIGF